MLRLHPSIERAEDGAMRMSPVGLVSITSWRWRHWLGLAIVAGYVVSYLGLLTWGDVDHAIEDMASYSTARDGSAQAPSRQHEALFVVFAFLLLTVPAVLALALVTGLVVLVVSGALEPLTQRAGLPEATPRLVVLVVLAALVWQYQERWLPPLRWILSLVAGAYLAVNR
jgi:hypothetical protein